MKREHGGQHLLIENGVADVQNSCKEAVEAVLKVLKLCPWITVVVLSVIPALVSRTTH